MKQKQKSGSFKENRSSISQTFGKLLDFVKAKPFFFIALFVVLVFGLALILFPQSPADASEKAEYAKSVHADNLFVLNGLIEMVDQNQPGEESTLDDDYYYSIRDDLEWLKSKEDSLYNSKPAFGVYPKEIAFALFAQLIIEVNDSFSIEAGISDQTGKIKQALDTNVSPYDFLSDDAEINAAFNVDEKKIFIDAVAYLTSEYVNDKKTLINQTTSIERKYVEAKKIVILSEYS